MWVKRDHQNTFLKKTKINRESNETNNKKEHQGKTDKQILELEISMLFLQELISRQKISKDKVDLSRTVNKLNLINIYRIFYQTTTEYTFFLSLNKTFTKR